MTYERYAIYLTAPPGPFADAGAAWLGWDIAKGEAVEHPSLSLLRPLAEITERPRKYGFHGTIKPPFYLADGQSPEVLASSARALCAAQPAVTLDGLLISRLGSFVAFTPTGNTDALAELAATIVKGLDKFRAPASRDELARRRQANLSASQEAALVAWGYPYVLENFRFHLTLTGPLAKGEADAVVTAANDWFAGCVPSPFPITHLTLCGQLPNGHFQQIARLPLLG